MPHNNHHHSFHLPHWDFNWRLPGLTGLYLNASLRNFAISMTNIFIPLYILKTTGSINYIFVFYLVYYCFVLLFDYPLSLMVTKIGPDLSALISNMLLGLYLFFLILIEKNLIFILLAGITNAALVPLYWLPYHLAFVKLGRQEKYGESVSFFSFFGRLSSALGPVIGGFMIVVLGFENLFLSAVILVLISTIPLFFDRFNKTAFVPSFKKICSGLTARGYRNNLLAFWGAAFESLVYTVFWPLYIYSVVASYKTLGIISSAALFLSMLALLWAGRQVDKKGPGILKIGAIGNSLNWIIRVFLNTARQIFMADFIYHLGSALVWTSFDTAMYKKAVKENTFEFLIKREMALHSGGLVALLLIWFVWIFFQSWLLIFGVSIIGLFLTGLMIKSDE